MRFIVCALMVFACCLCGCSSDKNDIYLAHARLYEDSFFHTQEYSLYFNYVYTGKDVIFAQFVDARLNIDIDHCGIKDIFVDGERQIAYSGDDVDLLTPNTSITVCVEVRKSTFNSLKNIGIEIYYINNATDKTETTIAKKTFNTKSLLKDVKKYVDIEKDE